MVCGLLLVEAHALVGPILCRRVLVLASGGRGEHECDEESARGASDSL